jgi:hypothetical protein
MIPPKFNVNSFKGRLLQDELKLPQANGNSPVMPISSSFSSPFCTNEGKQVITDIWVHLGLHGTISSGVDFPLLYPSTPNFTFTTVIFRWSRIIPDMTAQCHHHPGHIGLMMGLHEGCTSYAK